MYNKTYNKYLSIAKIIKLADINQDILDYLNTHDSSYTLSKQIIEYIERKSDNDYVTIREIAKTFKININTTRCILRAFKEQGLLEKSKLIEDARVLVYYNN